MGDHGVDGPERVIEIRMGVELGQPFGAGLELG
jgi:hypothetical protein